MKQLARLFCIAIAGLLAGCAPEQMPSVNIFVTADIEGVFWSRPEPRYGNEVTGGLGVLKSFLDKQTEPFLLLEGGNWFAHTPEGTLSQGDYFNTLAKTIPYTARLFTRQDLIYGWGSLSHVLKNSPTPFVLSNVTLASGYLPAGSKPWLISKVADYKVGIIGLVNPLSAGTQQRGGGLQIAEPIETARKLVPFLREKGAQVIIVLSSLGLAEDKSAPSNENLVEEVSGIDLIISSGMSRENAEAEQIGKTWLIYPGSRLDSVGKIQLFFNKNAELANVQFTDIVLYKRDFGEDETISAQTEQLRSAARSQMVRSVGTSGDEFVGALAEESVLGDWTADCLRKWAKADAAVINSSSLRAPLPLGAVTQYDLYNLYPYNDHVTYLTIKGAALRQALEESLAVVDNFPQISGMQIKYRPTAPVGKRISSIKINGEPLVPANTYRVAVTDYMLSGGAGHDGFIDSLEFKNTQVEMRTVLRLCLAGNKPVSKPEGKRWSVSK